MKLVTLSLAAILGLSTVAFAADTLADAFKNGKFDGQFMLASSLGNSVDTGATGATGTNNKKTASVGMHLNYNTDDFYGFKLGLGFQTAHDLGLHEKDATYTHGTSEDEIYNTVSSTNLHQAFLQYSLMKSTIIVGRQEIHTPLILNGQFFPLVDSFDAATVTSADIPNTVVTLMYIKNWNKMFGSDADTSGVLSTIEQKDYHFEHPLYSIFFRNTSLPGLALDGQYLTTNQEGNNGDFPMNQINGYDQYYIRADYKLPIAYPVNVGAMYGGANFDTTTVAFMPPPLSPNYNDSTSFYGFKLGTEVSGVKLAAAYTKMSDDADYPATFGHVPDALLYSYTSMLINFADYAGMEAMSLQADYNFGIPGLKAMAKYGHFDQSSKGAQNSIKASNFGTSDEVNLDVSYAPSGSLKGFGVRAWLGYATYDNYVAANDGGDYNAYGRFYLTYKF